MPKPQRIEIDGKRTRLQSDRLRRWIQKWRSRLNVEHWTFNVMIETAPHTRDATIRAQTFVNERYTQARIHVYPIFWTETATEQERTVVHELMHVPTHRLGKMLDDLVPLKAASQEAVDDVWETLTEYITNIAWDRHE